MKSWSWVLLIIGTIFIKWASWYPGWVEQNYSLGIYVIASTQRFLFGWLPVSLGDLFYGFLILVILYKTFYSLPDPFQKTVYPPVFYYGFAANTLFYPFCVCVI